MSGNKIFKAAPTRAVSAVAFIWIDCLLPRMLQRAARNSPESLWERLTEEWSAHLAEQRGPIARLRFVLGCYWAATVIKHEHQFPVPILAESSPTGRAAMTVHRHPGRSTSTLPRLQACAASTDAISEINITPLIDVMLVLLVTLIVSLPTMTHAVKLDLPRQESRQQAIRPDIINLDIDSDGTVVWNGTVLAGLQQLESYLRAEAQRNPQAEIHLRPDRRAKYDVVAKVLASAQHNRMKKMAFTNTAEFTN